GNQVTTLGILPDGQVFFRNTSPRKMIAAAYNMDESMITGGPDWLDSDRVDVTAKAAPATSQAERLSMVQALLAEKFKLTLHHSPKPEPVYALAVGKGGPRLQPKSTAGVFDCGRTNGDPKQVHVLCHGASMSDLAEELPKMAPGYLSLPVVNKTSLQGAYDFQLDWMGRVPYAAAAGAVAAGAAKDPMAVSIFDAVAKLGLSLEKDENPKDAIVVDSAERVSAKGLARKAEATSVAELTTGQVSDIDRF